MKFITANLKHCTISLQLWRHSLGFFFLTWKFNQTTPWSWICLASWMGSCVHTCSDVYSRLDSITNLGDLNSPTNGTEWAALLALYNYSDVSSSGKSVNSSWNCYIAKMVCRITWKLETYLFSQQGKACIISDFHLFFNQLIMAVNGCFSEKIWLSSLSTTNVHSP